MRTIRALRLGFLSACLAAVFVVSSTGTVLASTHYGSNGYTRYRLPWQYGQSHGLSQGYNQGNHSGTLEQYSLDFPMPNGTPVLGITEGWACRNTGSGLGNFVVQLASPPAGSGRSGTDYYFYGHNDSSWVSSCANGWTYLYEGQIASWSDNTGNSTGPHLHITLQNPGGTCYCGSAVSVPFPALSGVNFGAFAGQDPPVEYFVSDSVMPGDDNVLPQPNWNADIFNNWSGQGGIGVVGSPFDNGVGPGVHSWGPGVVQDFADPTGYGIIMQYNGTGPAYWVHGAIRDAYFSQFGGWASLGYPISNEYQWGSYRRSDFQYGSICAGMPGGTFLCSNPPTPTNTPTASQTEVLRPTANGTYLEWGELWGSGTTHWDRVEEVTPDDSGSYIMDNTWNGTERDTFQLSDTSYTSIASIEVFVRAERITTNDNNNVKLFIRSNGIDAESGAKTLSASWGYVSQVWTTDPATGVAWTPAAVNALQAGMRNAMGPNGGGGVAVTQVYVVVSGSGQGQILRPRANGTYLEWGELLGSGTTHWDRVAEVNPDDLGSYLFDNTWSGTERDTFQLSTTSYTSISSIEVFVRAERTTAPNDSNNLRVFIRSGGTDAQSAIKTLSGSWGYVSQVWSTNPATGLPWTPAAVNVLQAGIRNAMGPGGPGGVAVRKSMLL
jgi:hypothetical protein